MSEIDPRTYRPRDKLLYAVMLVWIIAWASALIISPFGFPEMLFKIPVSLTLLIITLQIIVPRLRFSGLANMISYFILIATLGLGLILRAV